MYKSLLCDLIEELIKLRNEGNISIENFTICLNKHIPEMLQQFYNLSEERKEILITNLYKEFIENKFVLDNLEEFDKNSEFQNLIFNKLLKTIREQL
ncbi:MAG: hypothetical protein [Cotesia congregata filamentous virus 2]